MCTIHNMGASDDRQRLIDVIARLRAARVVPAVADRLRDGVDATAQAIRTAALAEVEALAGSGNPDIVPELEAHIASHLEEVCRLLAGEEPGRFEFVAAHAARRAEQKFPLDAILHTYHCMHRVMAGWIRDSALAVADHSAHVRRVVADVNDFTIDYAGAVSSRMTSVYVDHTRLLAEAEGDRRSELLNILLDGYDEADARAARLLRRAGYLQQRQSYCVAVARSVNAREMESAARAQRMADAIAQALAGLPLRKMIGMRDNLVVAVLSSTRRLSGWTAPQSALAHRVYPRLRMVGPAALIGLSNDVPSTAHIPRAAAEARLALDYASVSDRVVPIARIPFRSVLVAHGRQGVQAALPPWLDEFVTMDQRARGALSIMLETYADTSMNVQQAAGRLGIHANTIYARMQRIHERTGMNPLEYHALTEMLLALECRGAINP